VPTKNRARQLKLCLDSLVIQDFDGFDVIIADSSDDNTTKLLCDNFQEKFFSLKYIRADKPGISAARNLIVACCKTDLLIFVDDDVYLDKGCFKKLIDCYSKSPDPNSTAFSCMIDLHTYGVSAPGRLLSSGVGVNAHAEVADYFISALILLPRRIYSNILWPERLTTYGGEDLLYGLQCRRVGFKFGFCSEILASHDREIIQRARPGPSVASNLVYLMLYKHILVKPSLNALLIFETYGLFRHLLWRVQPLFPNIFPISSVASTFIQYWVKGHYWFAKDVQCLK